ncbi:GTP pyrophosphokinase [Arthrobacter castelli]|uniref:GTP pyrophosphokinase n=1 Tax=Arthrobacter castelli TaxID=271431 RepID=UPI0004163E90|nr:hypothetical protein [Arthrobacter castelli]
MEEPVAHQADVDKWMREYSDDDSKYKSASKAILAAVRARLDDDGLNYHVVDERVKESKSLRRKLSRTLSDGSPKYINGTDDIDDIIGLRVITYLNEDVELAMAALRGSFNEIEHVDKTSEQKRKGEFGYSGQHLVLQIGQTKPPNGCSAYTGQRFEVQVRTVLQHAWAEFEHDVRYKAASRARPEINRAFTLASGLIELADQQFTEINKMVSGQKAEGEVPIDDDDDVLTGSGLLTILEGNLPDNPRSKMEQYGWLVELFNANGVTTASKASSILGSADWQFIRDRIKYKFDPGHVRIVDDFLLNRWKHDYIDRTEDLGEDGRRRDKLEYRLHQLEGSTVG